MEKIILIVHVMVAIGLIGFILIQHGKGAEAGASFGSGASQTIFGSQGSGNFLTRATAILVTLFFLTSLALGYLASSHKPQDLDELLNKIQPGAISEPIPAIPEKGLEKDNDIPTIPTE